MTVNEVLILLFQCMNYINERNYLGVNQVYLFDQTIKLNEMTYALMSHIIRGAWSGVIK